MFLYPSSNSVRPGLLMVLQLALYCLEWGEREGEVTAGALQCEVYSKA